MGAPCSWIAPSRRGACCSARLVPIPLVISERMCPSVLCPSVLCRLLVVNGRKLLLLDFDDPLFRLVDWVVLPGDVVAVSSVWDQQRDVRERAHGDGGAQFDRTLTARAAVMVCANRRRH